VFYLRFFILKLKKFKINSFTFFLLLENGIKNSNKVLCFITQKYIDSPNCRLELHFAFTLRKPMVICMLERIPIDKIEYGIASIIA